MITTPEVGDFEGWQAWLKAYGRSKKHAKYNAKRDKKKENSKLRERRRVKKEKRLSEEKPFVGVDGEGAGDGMDHIYWLLRVGDKALYHDDGSLLKTNECLAWLANLGEQNLNDFCIPVAYFFDYDVSMMLRYLPEKNLRELFWQEKTCLISRCKHLRTMHWKGYGSCADTTCTCKKYQAGGQTTIFLDRERPTPESHSALQVQVRHRQFKVRWYKGYNIKGGWFTITDVADFFQTSFLKTLEKWQVATEEEFERIRVNKDRRAYFTYGYDEETFDYNWLECKLLAKLMEEFRGVCFESGLHPDMWTGPGRLAECVFQMEDVPTRDELDLPDIVNVLSDYAYYGGRTEGIQFGEIDKILSLDIASAYPAAYRQLPCLRKGHGKWVQTTLEEVRRDNLEHTLVTGKFHVEDYMGKMHPKICGLPMRDTRGEICFPTNAYGSWWYPEVRETLKLYDQEGYKYKIEGEVVCFSWKQSCNDLPGGFTDRWYRKRLALGKSTRGIPTKLCLNSLYGKAAQRVGSPKWANAVWAGLLTAYTRARLLEATSALGPSNIISFQTDGIFLRDTPSVREALTKLDVWQGDRASPDLGTWELEEYDSIFLIQSGVYSLSRLDEEGQEKITNKTRGMRDYEFEAALPEIREQWKKRGWFGEFDLTGFPSFVTSQLGILWNSTSEIGCWKQRTRKISFYTNINKRELYPQGKWYSGDPAKDNWKKTGNYTKNGETWAPNSAHAMKRRRMYGDNPLKPGILKVAGEKLPPVMFEIYQNDMFSIPYSTELSLAYYLKRRENEDTWSYATPDQPYILSDD